MKNKLIKFEHQSRNAGDLKKGPVLYIFVKRVLTLSRGNAKDNFLVSISIPKNTNFWVGRTSLDGLS